MDIIGEVSESAEVWFERGMIALGMEIEMQARVSEQIGGALLDESFRLQVASALRACLTSAQISLEVDSMIDDLIRRVDAARKRAVSPIAIACASPEDSASSVPPSASVPDRALRADVWPGEETVQQPLSPDSEGELPRADRTSGWLVPREPLGGANEEWE
jgi:hypothetical protein